MQTPKAWRLRAEDPMTQALLFTTAPARIAPITVMPWGKFRGRPIAKLPLFYINWLLDKATLRRELRTALEEEVERRWDGTSQYWE